MRSVSGFCPCGLLLLTRLGFVLKVLVKWHEQGSLHHLNFADAARKALGDLVKLPVWVRSLPAGGSGALNLP